MKPRPKITELQFDRRAEELRELIRDSVSPFAEETLAEQQARITRARADRAYFLETYFPHYFYSEFAGFHREWLDLADRENDLVLVAAPREHAKTTIFTFGIPLHALVFRMRRFILIVSDTEDQAAGFTLPIRMEIEENVRLRHDFGDLAGRLWRDADFVTSTDVRVKARGRGQKLRGLKWKQFRPDMAVVDDFENDANVRNPKLVKEGMDWLLTALLGSLAEPYTFVMVGNLFAARSILARLMAEAGDDGKPLYPGRVYRAMDDDGNPLWPSVWSRERLERRRRQMGTVRFNREMMNMVVDEENPIRPEWFETYDPAAIEGKKLAVASFLDPSAKSGQANDYKAIVTVGLDMESSDFYVLHAWIRKATIVEMLDAAYSIHANYGGAFGVEVNMLEDFLMKAFDDYARERNAVLPITRVRHAADKEARMLGTLAPLLEFGRLKFRRGHSDQSLLVEQIQYITDPSVNDDGPDALEAAVSLLTGGSAPNIW